MFISYGDIMLIIYIYVYIDIHKLITLLDTVTLCLKILEMSRPRWIPNFCSALMAISSRMPWMVVSRSSGHSAMTFSSGFMDKSGASDQIIQNPRTELRFLQFIPHTNHNLVSEHNIKIHIISYRIISFEFFWYHTISYLLISNCSKTRKHACSPSALRKLFSVQH